MEITPKDYLRFKEILESQSGILLGENKQYLVISRLNQFIQKQGFSCLGELLDAMLKVGSSGLLKQVIELMTTNETLWFRDTYPFEYLKSHIVPQLTEKSFAKLRIWCAACSTGQEPYSIAMQLADMGKLVNSEIIATDLSERVINKARLGIYQQLELNRGMPQEKRTRFFQAHEGSDLQVAANLRSRIRFQTLNLLQTPYTLGQFDVIFCRNVLIYFSKENKSKVLNGLIDKLKPGGYLFLGASEALTSDSQQLTMIRCNPGLVYHKKA